MRILHVTAGIGRSNGVMSVILNYARHMPKDIAFDVMYFVQTDDDRVSEIEALGGRAIKIVPPGLHSFRKDDVDAYLSSHMKTFWRGMSSLARGAFLPALYCAVCMVITDPFNPIVFLVTGAGLVLIYAFSMWLWGMNDYEKSLVLRTVQKLTHRKAGTP